MFVVYKLPSIWCFVMAVRTEYDIDFLLFPPLLLFSTSVFFFFFYHLQINYFYLNPCLIVYGVTQAKIPPYLFVVDIGSKHFGLKHTQIQSQSGTPCLEFI